SGTQSVGSGDPTSGVGPGSGGSGPTTGAGGISTASSGAGGDPTGTAQSSSGMSSSSSGAASSSSSSSSAANSASRGGSPVDMLCARWNSDRADQNPGVWSGNVNGCNPGDMSAIGRANALKNVNLYRFVAGQPPVTTDAMKNQYAQACALMMDANNMLNHS